MSIVLYHHPFSRAATVLWMLEELGLPYTLRCVDFAASLGPARDASRRPRKSPPERERVGFFVPRRHKDGVESG